MSQHEHLSTERVCILPHLLSSESQDCSSNVHVQTTSLEWTPLSVFHSPILFPSFWVEVYSPCKHQAKAVSSRSDACSSSMSYPNVRVPLQKVGDASFVCLGGAEMHPPAAWGTALTAGCGVGEVPCSLPSPWGHAVVQKESLPDRWEYKGQGGFVLSFFWGVWQGLSLEERWVGSLKYRFQFPVIQVNNK